MWNFLKMKKIYKMKLIKLQNQQKIYKFFIKKLFLIVLFKSQI